MPRIFCPRAAAFWNFFFPYFFRPIAAATAPGSLMPGLPASWPLSLGKPTYAISYLHSAVLLDRHRTRVRARAVAPPAFCSTSRRPGTLTASVPRQARRRPGEPFLDVAKVPAEPAAEGYLPPSGAEVDPEWVGPEGGVGDVELFVPAPELAATHRRGLA